MDSTFSLIRGVLRAVLLSLICSCPLYSPSSYSPDLYTQPRSAFSRTPSPLATGVAATMVKVNCVLDPLTAYAVRTRRSHYLSACTLVVLRSLLHAWPLVLLRFVYVTAFGVHMLLRWRHVRARIAYGSRRTYIACNLLRMLKAPCCHLLTSTWPRRSIARWHFARAHSLLFGDMHLALEET